ncbi:carbohydrate-binding domain-containing protein [Aquimarina litoralis]|uniref:carbohydrate-binding domain-containing protein n=1 Tax=Aquimarina litoralis TaxID=584605 RepID=UPI0031D7835C
MNLLIRKFYLLIPFSILLSIENINAQNQEQLDFRDPSEWPFTKHSIWNMPIGSDANYKDAKFQNARYVGIDTQHIIITNNNDPIYKAIDSPTWGPGRCSGSEYLGFDVPFPKEKIIHDAGNSPYGNTPNANFVIIYPDGETALEGSKIARCKKNGKVYFSTFMKYPNNRKRINIKKNDGVKGVRGQGATKMSALGGTIRLGELTGKKPLRHVIKINPWAAKYCHYSSKIPGYKWPATKADNYAGNSSHPQAYNKKADPDIVMGSLFAIPPNLKPQDINIKTEPGKILFKALQDYGMYFTENAAWDAWNIIAEEGVQEEVEHKYNIDLASTNGIWKDEVNKLMRALHVITNNSPNSIGGGGIPRRTLAPDFKNLSKVIIRAKGKSGKENMRLIVGDKVLKKWINVKKSYKNYFYKGVLPCNSNTVKVEYYGDDGPHKELIVDYLKIDNTIFQSEKMEINTGAWDNDSRTCGKSYSEKIHCNGFIEYKLRDTNFTSITIRAKGKSGKENMRLLVGDRVLKKWTNIKNSYNNYFYKGVLPCNNNTVKVEYYGDDGPQNDLIVDYLKIDNTIFQSENMDTNTGAWDNDSRTCGKSYSEIIHCNGYIEFKTINKAKSDTDNDFDLIRLQDEYDIKLFPNPLYEGNDLGINLVCNEDNEAFKVEIFTLSGKKIFSSKLKYPQEEKYVIPRHVFSSEGIFIIKFTNIKNVEKPIIKKILVK